jgi:signal transduction histidine kinase
VTWDGESQQRFIVRIAAESARLGRLVDDLLDFSAIESGILRLQRDWCDIPLVLDAAIACLPPVRAPMVEVECDPGLPVVWADHDRLEQVFVNLLTNALGHNPPGTRVRISASVDGAGVDGAGVDGAEAGGPGAGGPAGVTVSVTDDGAGMPADVAAAPFEPMRRRRTPSAGAGAGLGLSIARGIVVAHGGRIGLEQPARGTCFLIHLPVEMPAAPAVPAPPAPRGRAVARPTTEAISSA